MLVVRNNPPKVDSLPKRAEQVVFWDARNDSGYPKPGAGDDTGGWLQSRHPD